MDESDRLRESFMGSLTYRRNGRVLNYFRHLSLWGTVMLIVNVIALHLSSGMLIGGPYSNDMVLFVYHGFLLWSMLALPVSFIFSLAYMLLYLPRVGEGLYNVFQIIGKLIAADFSAPFRVVRTFVSKDWGKKNFVGLITMIIFIVMNVFAIIKSI